MITTPSDSKTPTITGRFGSTTNSSNSWFKNPSGRFMTRNLNQHMIQKSLLRQVVSGQRKLQATHDSNIPAKAGRFWSTKYLKQLMIQKPLPRQVVSGQQKTSSNSWFKNPCQNRSFLVNDKPQATHDSKIPAKAGRFWSTKYLKQPMRPPMIHTSSTNLSIEHLSNDPLVTLKNSRNGFRSFRSVQSTESTKRGLAPH